jgi:ribonuclease PH
VVTPTKPPDDHALVALLDVGTRPDGRAADTLRPISFQRRYTKHAAGSVLVTVGDTQVIVTASIDEKVPKHVQHDHGEGHGWLTAEYAMLPSATHTRNQRERQKISGRSTEIQRLIGRCLRASVNLTQLGARTITIDADVIQADGGTRVAAITGGFIAMADAVQSLLDAGLLDTPPTLTPVAAISVGLIHHHPLLDLCYLEDFAADVDANVVMTAQGDFIECQLSCEGHPFSRTDLETLLTLADTGLRQIITLQRQTLSDLSFTV